MSPSLIHPIFLQKAEQSKDKIAGKIKHKSNKESQSEAVTAIFYTFQPTGIHTNWAHQTTGTHA